MDRTRSALIVASDHYTDPKLRRLRAPSSDAQALAGVLRDPAIGGFEVHTLLNKPVYEVNLAVEEFFADRRPGDLLLLHFSCHGVKNEAGELHLATTNTLLRRLGSTAVPARFVMACMDRCRSRRMVLLLDCCHAGAFERGMTARAGGEVDIEAQFGGRGRAVITASSAMEYAFEGDELADAQELGPSVFTSALVQGLETGDADRDQDGMVGLDELYDYVYDKVREATPNQTPGKWILGVEGELHIARRSRPVTTPAPLPPELQQLLSHPYAATRAGVVEDLARLLHDRHAGLALAARQALERLTEDDSRRVAAAATAALSAQVQPPPEQPPPEQAPPEPAPPEPARPQPAPPELVLSTTVVDFGRLLQQGQSPERRVRLGNAGGGVLNARAATQASWLKLRQVGDELVLSVETTAVGQHEGVVSVDSDGGSATIRVTTTVDPQPAPTPQPRSVAVTQPPATGQTTTARVQQPPSRPPTPPAHATRVRPQPAGPAEAVRGDQRARGKYYEGDKLASWGQRSRAGIIDSIPSVILFVLWGNFCSDDSCYYLFPSLLRWIGLVAFTAVKIYSRWYLQGRTGQSWGKRTLGLKLVRLADKQPIGAAPAFSRGLAHLLDILTLGIGYLFPLWDARRQTLADKVAKTIVISQDKAGPRVSRTPETGTSAQDSGDLGKQTS